MSTHGSEKDPAVIAGKRTKKLDPTKNHKAKTLTKHLVKVGFERDYRKRYKRTYPSPPFGMALTAIVDPSEDIANVR